MKIRDTVSNLVKNYPSLQRLYIDVTLAAAREISDSVSLRVIHAHAAMLNVDPDNEAQWNNVKDELEEAERVFHDIHANTEITL